MFILSKEYSFEASHRLSKGFVGKCCNIHGHSWHGEVQFHFSSYMHDQDMGIDYSDLKAIINRVIDKYDHAIILYKGDTEIIDFINSQNMKLVVLDENPTSEVLAKLISKEVAIDLVKSGFFESFVQVFKVILKETATSKCEY